MSPFCWASRPATLCIRYLICSTSDALGFSCFQGSWPLVLLQLPLQHRPWGGSRQCSVGTPPQHVPSRPHCMPPTSPFRARPPVQGSRCHTGPDCWPRTCTRTVAKLTSQRDTGARGLFLFPPCLQTDALRRSRLVRCSDRLHLTPSSDFHGTHPCIDSHALPASLLLSLTLASLEFSHQ